MLGSLEVDIKWIVLCKLFIKDVIQEQSTEEKEKSNHMEFQANAKGKFGNVAKASELFPPKKRTLGSQIFIPSRQLLP